MTTHGLAPDPRFFDALGPVSVEELARLTGAQIDDRTGAERSIWRVSSLTKASEGSVCYFSDRRYTDNLSGSDASACFLAAQDAGAAPPGCVALIHPLPQAAYVVAADRLHRRRIHPAGAPAVHPEAELEEDVQVGVGAVIGMGACIGARTVIAPGAVIGPGVTIGRDGFIGANAVIGCALIGDRVRILAGAVIGEAGFGATLGPAGVMDVPQLGRVILQDSVSVGANSCIDRGAFEDTVVGENTKIDNLVQIAHNVVIGRNCLLAAHTGISGTVVVGDGCQFGGRAGIADHVTIGAGARIAAAAGVMKDVPPGESWGGSPARPVRQWLRETAATASLVRQRKDKEKRS